VFEPKNYWKTCLLFSGFCFITSFIAVSLLLGGYEKNVRVPESRPKPSAVGRVDSTTPLLQDENEIIRRVEAQKNDYYKSLPSPEPTASPETTNSPEPTTSPESTTSPEPATSPESTPSSEVETQPETATTSTPRPSSTSSPPEDRRSPVPKVTQPGNQAGTSAPQKSAEEVDPLRSLTSPNNRSDQTTRELFGTQ
jgi:outer membrane biosynthesis protein TonB